jgi:biopolymer transport protein ExbD
MAEKRRFLDVWILESNTVYREVPFDVVADWVQQGRLLEDDKVRPSGKGEWVAVGAMPGLTVYVPKPAPAAAEESPVEAMEPVAVGFTWKRKAPEDDDSEVDMIPLIDVSLVLLVIFAIQVCNSVRAAGAPPPIATPEAANGGKVTTTPDSVAVGVDFAPGGGVVYSVSVGGRTEAADRSLPSREALLGRLDDLLKDKGAAAVELTINANKDLPSGEVRRLLVDLQKAPFHGKIGQVFTGVTGKK